MNTRPHKKKEYWHPTAEEPCPYEYTGTQAGKLSIDPSTVIDKLAECKRLGFVLLPH